MVKCKRCDQDDLTWDKEYNESTGKWRLWNTNTERPHECGKKKDIQDPMSKRDRKLWKTAWKPIMDLPSQRVCGVCKTLCVTVSDCDYCEELRLNPCKHWCPKCKEHPRVIYVEIVPEAKEEFKKTHPEEK